ncbi:MAG: response regulator [Pseudomonadota bacterium]
MAPHILIVDDDPHIRDVLVYALARADMTSDVAATGREALARFDLRPPDLMVLDVGMPEMDGLDVCREVRRQSDVPILFLSARSEEVDRIVGLELGGDDYVTKPFSPREVVARITAILKRVRGRNAGEAGTADEPLVVGPLALDRACHQASFAGTAVALTGLEIAILEILARRPGRVLSRSDLVASAYGAQTHVSDRTIDSHIRNIRAKFAAVGCEQIILTVHGLGFRLAELPGP